MPINVFSELDSGFFETVGNNIEIEFGSDEFPVIADVGSFPSWGTEPSGSDDDLYFDNTGSRGSFKGIYLESGDYVYIKKWQFQYCTDE